MNNDTQKVDVLHAIAQADVALGMAGLPEDEIFRRELRAAGAVVAELIEADVAFNQAFHAWNANKSDQKVVDAFCDAADVRASALARVGGAK